MGHGLACSMAKCVFNASYNYNNVGLSNYSCYGILNFYSTPKMPFLEKEEVEGTHPSISGPRWMEMQDIDGGTPPKSQHLVDD